MRSCLCQRPLRSPCLLRPRFSLLRGVASRASQPGNGLLSRRLCHALPFSGGLCGVTLRALEGVLNLLGLQGHPNPWGCRAWAGWYGGGAQH